MNLINQFDAVQSLNEALLPDSLLIDGRTEQDRLAFLVNFASLINFYDKNNEVEGNWSPFLLKDPVFLLASISKTDFSNYYSLYLNTCTKLQQVIELAAVRKSEHIPIANSISKELAFNMNQLFDQLMFIYRLIERWTYYMQLSHEDYDLKTYVLSQVKTNFSGYLWALLGLRGYLYTTYGKLGMEPPNLYLYDSFSKIIWKENKNKSPYWEILGLDYPVKNNSPMRFYTAVKKTGDELFDFLHAIITQAAADFKKVKAIKSRYPDTTLLRTFVNLLSIQQDQLNEISQKHLQFYYRDILKQSELFARADNAIVCAGLAKPDATFNLPAGTLFNAGIDAQKNPVLFASTQDVNLNPASITAAYTINKVQGAEPDIFSSLYLNTVPNPGIINRDKDGKIKYWETFGGATSTGPQVKQGIAFASPMLLLREGKRTIKFYLTYTGSIDLQMLKDASYYLSTQNSWLYIESKLVKIYTGIPVIDPLTEKSVVIEIALEATEPPIESFIKNPDGLDSKWPMVKIQFVSFTDLDTPPVLTSLKIEVTVSDVKNLQFYNDNGPLSTKTPYQIFGPIPLVNSSFIIGSNEVFSKPLDSLYIELDWDKLPDNFMNYYQLYNRYLEHGLDITTPPPPQEQKKPLVKRFWNWFARKKEKDGAFCLFYPYPFNNYSFTVDFDLLQDSTWKRFDLTKRESINVTQDNQISAPNYHHLYNVTDPEHLLFSTNDAGELTGKSFFAYPPLVFSRPGVSTTGHARPVAADPNIQDIPFSFTDTSASGFMRITLTHPSLGFGSEVYPKVVSQTALYNSWVIYTKATPDHFVPVANLPFAPKLVNFIADYTASQTYDLTNAGGVYPLQCYLYAPFTNYKVYDNSAAATEYSYTLKRDGTAAAQACSVPLFAPFNYNGCLYLQLENLLPSTSINLYFELSKKYVPGLTEKPAEYYYLSDAGWKELAVLSDGTNNFNCPGIIKVAVPYDITNASPLMPQKKYWFYIGVKDNYASAQTVFLKTNGIGTQRSGASFLTDLQAPKLAANAITGLQTAVPQIATVIQPFPSYGGKAAENSLTMNERVSNRLKTKDRAVTAGDYFRLISQEYSDIYYSRAVFDKKSGDTMVYVVKVYESWTDPTAFAPQVSACVIDEIRDFLLGKASEFARIGVSNFDLFPINITTTVLMRAELVSKQLQIRDNIAQALDIYLSPWIVSSGEQMVIDQEITEAQLARFVQALDGVLEVQSISFLPVYIGRKIKRSTLFVSGMEHQIDLKFSPQ